MHLEHPIVPIEKIHKDTKRRKLFLNKLLIKFSLFYISSAETRYSQEK